MLVYWSVHSLKLTVRTCQEDTRKRKRILKTIHVQVLCQFQGGYKIINKHILAIWFITDLYVFSKRCGICRYLRQHGHLIGIPINLSMFTISLKGVFSMSPPLLSQNQEAVILQPLHARRCCNSVHPPEKSQAAWIFATGISVSKRP